MRAYPWSLDGKPPPARTQRTWRRFFLHHLTNVAILLMVALLVSIVLYPYVVMTVPSGHVGVLWKRFRGGTALDPEQLRDEGLRLIMPWNKLFLYDLRLQSTTETYNAISKDGVSLSAAINIRFRLKHHAIPKLHQIDRTELRPQRWCVPKSAAGCARVIAEYTAEEVYSTEAPGNSRPNPRTDGGHAGREDDGTNGRSERVSTINIRIPLYDDAQSHRHAGAGHRAAGGRGHRHQPQDRAVLLSEEYTFRVEREKKELERKQIEAEGIREFQHNRQPRHLGFLPALARHRGNASARAVHEFEGRDRRRRQGRLADHSRQRGCAAAGTTSGRPPRVTRQRSAPDGRPPGTPSGESAGSRLVDAAEKTPAAGEPRSSRARPVRFRSRWAELENILSPDRRHRLGGVRRPLPRPARSPLRRRSSRASARSRYPSGRRRRATAVARCDSLRREKQDRFSREFDRSRSSLRVRSDCATRPLAMAPGPYP